jgi:hypothetical protein
MFKNLSLESKQIYQIELGILGIIAVVCIVINALKVFQLLKPTQAPAANTVREQQLQNAMNILAPKASAN